MLFMNHITWIRESLLRQKGVKTQYGLADALGKTPAVITRMMKGDRKLRADEIDVVAKYLNEEPPTDARKEKTDLSQKEFDLPVKVIDRNFQFEAGMIPVLGIANGSSEALVLNFDDPIGNVARHPSQKGMKGAFAFEPRGESMWPRYEEGGDMGFAIANKMPAKEQDCLIELNNGEAYLKRFVKKTDRHLLCRQFNPPKEWKRLLSEVRAIHAVTGTGRV